MQFNIKQYMDEPKRMDLPGTIPAGDKVEIEFRRALEQGRTYLPAILNLGNLHYVQEQWEQALEYYQQALGIDAKNPRVRLALAKVDQELSKFDDMRQNYEQLAALDPALASQYDSLGNGSSTGARSSDIETERREVVWEGE